MPLAFRGVWGDRGPFLRSQLPAGSHFRINLYWNNTSTEQYTITRGTLMYTSTFNYLGSEKYIQLFGICPPISQYYNHDEFILVGAWNNSPLNENWTYNYIISKNGSWKSHNDFIRSLALHYPVDHVSFDLFALFIGVSKSRFHTTLRHFDLPQELTGSITTPNNEYRIKGMGFDAHHFHIEMTLYCVLVGLMSCLTLLAWLSLFRFLDGAQQLRSISLTCIELVSIVNFTFQLVTTQTPAQDPFVSRLYWFLFFAGAIFLIFVQTPGLGFLIQKKTGHRAMLLVLHIAFLLCSIGTLIGITVTQGTSFALTALAASVWVPQIIRTARLNQRHSIDPQFVGLTTFNIAMMVFYNYLYPGNVTEYVNIPFGAAMLVWLALQVLLMYIQYERGRGGIPKWIARPLYNYQEVRPASGTECVICFSDIGDSDEAFVTPCGHAFHGECLRRWMDQHQSCPLCREMLPPLTDELLSL